jgi:hypothetical protein
MTLTRALAKGTIQEQGAALMRRFAPGVTLESRLLGGRTNGAWYDPLKNEIKWPIADGLTVLLHEIAHYKLKHVTQEVYVTKGTDPGEVIARGIALWEEVTAWLWAEETANRLGVAFDYSLAEHYFNRKKFNRKMPLVKLNWRYRSRK